MKKKFLTPVIATLALSCATSVFSACEKTGGGNAPQQNAEIHDIYTSYVTNAEENGETPLSYEEWLAVIKGEKGGISDKTQIFEFYPLDDGTYSVSVGKATQMNNVSLPAAYKGKPVTAISEKGFDKCENLISITLPDTITSIGNYAFRSCYKLTSITMPDSVTSIGSYAFEQCSGLTSITIPNSVTSIGIGAFSNCSSLTSITRPNSVTSIGEQAFFVCSSLKSVTITNSVTSIGSDAFFSCRMLTTITIPNSVTSIENSAFSYCDNLTSVYYKGSENEWNQMSIDDNNIPLTDATRYYYSATKPAASGNFWHYNSDGEIETW